MRLRKNGVVLLSLLVAAMAMVPMVSAGTNAASAAAPAHEIPSDYPNDSRTAQWLSESEMINIVISQETLEKFGQDKQSGIITIPVSYLDLKTTFTNSKEYSSFFTENSMRADDGIVLLRMPKQMYSRFIDDSPDGKLSLPDEYFFRYYENSSDLYSHIKADGNVLKVYPSEKYPIAKKLTVSPLESPLANSASVVLPLGTSAVLTYPQMFEAREYYNRIGSTNYDYCIGQITPESWTLLGSALDQFDIFQEREYRFNSNEAVEIVAKYRDRNQGGDIILFPAVYRSGAAEPLPSNQWTIWGGEVGVDKNDLPHAFGYHVQIYSGYYYIVFEDMETLDWLDPYLVPTAAGTSSFTDLWGSSEYRQKAAPTTNSFSASTNPVIDEWARILNGDWRKPNQVWNYVGPETDSYVSVLKTFDLSGNLITRSYVDYP
jgi:hypothetical protein